jgi:hypothetical protein
MKKSITCYLVAFGLLAGIAQAAVGDVSQLSRAELTKVEALLAKNLKGKPTVKSGQKEELDGGWKITCVADVGSGGEFELVVNSEKSMVLGSIVSQNPTTAKAAATKAPAAPKKG